MDPQPGFAETFDADYLRIYEHVQDQDRAEREAWEIVRALQIPAGESLLDCPCGFGRHALILARAGYAITGADRSAVFLEHARAQAAARGLRGEFVEADMRALPKEWDARFGGAYSVFTSFGYFESDAENQKVLSEMARVVRPGGHVLVETVNFVNLLAHFQSKTWFRGNRCMIAEELHYDWKNDRFTNRRVVYFDEGGQRTLPDFHIRAYKPAELLRMAERAGLTLIELAGGYDGKPFRPLESPRMVLLAEK